MNLRSLLQAAIDHRRALLERSDVVRLVNGAPDGLKDIVVERQGAVDIVYFYDEGARALATEAAHVLAEERVVSLWERKPRGQARLVRTFGDVPVAHIARENGVRFLVRTTDDKAVGTGIFADHRDGRALVKEHAWGKRVLNLFSHAGAFGAAAFMGGASQVTQVDAARKCAQWASVNLALNGADPRQHRFFVEDAFVALQKAVKRGRRYGMIVNDPPTTAIRPKGKRFVTRDEIENMSEDCARLLEPKGRLLFSLNDRSVPPRELLRKVEVGLARQGRHLEQVVFLTPGEDFMGGDEPMRGVFGLLN